MTNIKNKLYILSIIGITALTSHAAGFKGKINFTHKEKESHMKHINYKEEISFHFLENTPSKMEPDNLLILPS